MIDYRQFSLLSCTKIFVFYFFILMVHMQFFKYRTHAPWPFEDLSIQALKAISLEFLDVIFGNTRVPLNSSVALLHE